MRLFTFLFNLFFILSIFFATGSLNANSKISICLSSPCSMKIVIDGNKFYSFNNSITIANIPPGSHQLTFYYVKHIQGNYDFINANGVINWTKALSKSIIIDDNTYYDFIISKFGKTFSDKTSLPLSGGSIYVDSDELNYSNGYEESYDDLIFFRNKISKYNDNKSGLDRKNVISLMPDDIYSQLKNMLQKEIMDDRKFNLIKDGFKDYYITTAQAKELGKIFSMESNRVEYAKYIYNRVSDKKNFFTIYEIFTFQTSKDEVSEYIRSN